MAKITMKRLFIIVALLFTVGATSAQEVATTGLSLQDYIGIQCVIQKKVATGYDRVYAVAELADGTATEIEAIVYMTSYYVFDVPMLSNQMSEEVTVTLYGVKGEDVYKGASTTTSVQAQCMTRLNNANQNATTKRICADMLNYGAAVQTAFNHNTDNLANALMTEAHQAFATQETPVTEATDTVTGTGKKNPMQVSLSLRDKVEMQFIFAKGSMSAYEAHITVDGETTVVDGADFDSYGGYPLLRIAVKAANMRASYQVTLHEKATGEQVSKTYTNSVQAYANSQLGKTYNDLVIAMMKYGDAVAAL